MALTVENDEAEDEEHSLLEARLRIFFTDAVIAIATMEMEVASDVEESIVITEWCEEMGAKIGLFVLSSFVVSAMWRSNTNLYKLVVYMTLIHSTHCHIGTDRQAGCTWS